MVFLGYIITRNHYLYIYCLKRCALRVGAARGVVHCLTRGGGAAVGGMDLTGVAVANRPGPVTGGPECEGGGTLYAPGGSEW